MSSVRMSNNLRKQIEIAAKALFIKSEHKIRTSFAVDYHDRAAKEFVDTEFKPHITAGNIPIQYLAKINAVTYKMPYKVNEGGGIIVYDWSDEALLNPIEIIKLFDYYSEGFGKAKVLTIPPKFKFSMVLQDELSTWRRKIRTCNEEENDFMTEIKRITSRCNTIKQFLDTWPQGENLLPADVMRAFNTKPKKREKVPLITEEASVTLSATLLKRTIMS